MLWWQARRKAFMHDLAALYEGFRPSPHIPSLLQGSKQWLITYEQNRLSSKFKRNILLTNTYLSKEGSLLNISVGTVGGARSGSSSR